MANPSTAAIVQRLWEWRERHPEATFDEIDEIDEEVWRQFAEVQARVVEALSQPEQQPADTGEPAAGSAAPPRCPQCQTAMQRRGQRRRRVPTRQGQDVVLQRPYYVCPACETGHFPPG
jgi:hypothetical protein